MNKRKLITIIISVMAVLAIACGAILLFADVNLPFDPPDSTPTPTPTLNNREFEYRIENGSVILEKYIGEKTDVEIPTELEGVVVSTIGKSCFEDSSITSLYIPANITVLEDYMCRNAAKLEAIVFEQENTLRSIGADVIAGTAAEQKILSAHNGMILWGSILVKAVSETGGIYMIPDNVKSIAPNALAQVNATAVRFPYGYNVIRARDVEVIEGIEYIIVMSVNTKIEGTSLFESKKQYIKCQTGSVAEKFALDYNIYYDLIDDGEVWQYEYDKDDNVVITGYTGSSQNVMVPSYIDGRPVVQLGNGVSMFEGYGIRRIYIPKTVKTIGDMAARGAVTLASLDFEDVSCLKRIGRYAFEGSEFEQKTNVVNDACVVGDILVKHWGFGTVHVPQGVRVVSDCAFGEGVTNIVLPEDCEELDDGFLSNVTNLEWIYIPGTVTELSDSAFVNNREVTIECDSTSKIVDYAIRNELKYKAVFYWEYELNEEAKTAVLTKYTGKQFNVRVPAEIDGYKVVEVRSIRNSTIKEIFIPSTVKYIGDMFAYRLENLANVVFENIDNIAVMGAQAFSGTKFEADNADSYGIFSIGGFACGYVGSGDVVLSDDIRVITDMLFYGSDVVTIKINEECEVIGDRAFGNCQKLTHVYIPDRVLEIGEYITDGSVLAVIKCHGASYAEEYSKLYGYNYEIADYEGWLYEIDGDDVKLSAYIGKELHVILPEKIHGQPVTVIDEGCFMGTNVESVFIPKSIVKINKNAFENVATLKSVTFEDVTRLDFIGEKAFAGTDYIKSAVPDNGFLVLNGILISCELVGDIVIPYYVKEIADGVFTGGDINSVRINDGCRIIRSGAFTNLGKIVWSFIPESVTVIEQGAFEGVNGNLIIKNYGNKTVLDVIETHGFISDTVNVAFKYTLDGDNATLTQYVGVETEVNIPSTIDGYKVVAIGKDCFKDKNVTFVYIPDSITHIYSAAFGKQLSEVAFENEANIRYIDRNAFVQTQYEEKLNKDNNGFSVIGGILIRCTARGNVVLPSNVKQVVKGAFEGGITSITVNDGCKVLDSEAFGGMWSIKWISIPASVETIGSKLVVDNRIHFKCEAGSDAERYCFNNGYKYEIVNADEYEWQYIVEKGNVTLIKYRGNDIHVVVPNDIGGMPVVAIADGCFKDNVSILSMYISANVKSIGNEAFYGTKSMEKLMFGNKANITSVGYSAFEGCGAIPGLVDSKGCFVINRILVAYHGPATVIFSDMIKTVAGRVFYNNDAITTVMINPGCSTIEDEAFAGAKNIANILLPDSLQKIAQNSFDENAAFTAVCYDNTVALDFAKKNNYNIQMTKSVFEYEVKDGYVIIKKYNGASAAAVIPSMLERYPVKYIGAGCFENTAITSVWIPETVINIGDGAFSGCTKLETVSFGSENSIQFIGNSAFKGTVYENISGVDQNNLVSINGILIRFFGSGDVRVPSFVSGIAGGAFYDRQDITKITLSEGCKWIGKNAFSQMHSLQSVAIPKTVTSIDAGLFADCNEDIVIICSEGSYAHSFATDNNIAVELIQ